MPCWRTRWCTLGSMAEHPEQLTPDQLNADYAGCFRLLMRELLQWTDSQSEAHLKGCMEDPGIWLWYLHDGPCKEAAMLIIRERVGQVPGLKGVGLRQAVEHAIMRAGAPDLTYYPHEDPLYDWDAVRAQVNALLKPYGAKPL